MSNVDRLKDLERNFSDSNLLASNPESLKAVRDLYLNDELKKDLSIGQLLEDEKEILLDAIALVKNSGGDVARLFSEVIRHIVPLNTENGNFQVIGNGISSQFAKGCIFLSVPKLGENSTLQLAINTAHELGHQCLYIYQTADPIIGDGLDAPLYSFVRKTKRPAIQSFHACVALGFMVRFLREIENDNWLKNDYFVSTKANLEKDFADSLRSFDEVQFTELGELLFNDLRFYATAS
jgi:HEXXH motif-containing protein